MNTNIYRDCRICISVPLNVKGSKRVNMIEEKFIFYALLSISSLNKVFAVVVLDSFFSFGEQKKVVTGHVRQVWVLTIV